MEIYEIPKIQHNEEMGSNAVGMALAGQDLCDINARLLSFQENKSHSRGSTAPFKCLKVPIFSC